MRVTSVGGCNACVNIASVDLRQHNSKGPCTSRQSCPCDVANPLLLPCAGKAIHKEHHEQPYFHVSLDPPGLIIGVMLLAAGVFAGLLGPSNPLCLTATAAYWAAGAGSNQQSCAD